MSVTTGSETRPASPFVMWVGGTVRPVNMAADDLWFPTPDGEEGDPPLPPEGDTTTLGADIYGDHDATPRGVPAGYSWRESSDADPDVDSTGWQEYGAVNVWGQCFATNTTTGYAARLQARDPRLFFLVAGQWQEADVTAGSMSGAYYPGDYQSGSVGASTRQDTQGVWSAPLSGLDGEPDAFHWWWDGMYPRTAIPDDAQGILAVQDVRLTGDTTGCHVIAGTGVDLFATPRTVVDPQGWNHGIPNPRMRWVTSEWQTFCATTVSLATLTNSPPPT